PAEEKNRLLYLAADRLVRKSDAILAANEEDIVLAAAEGMSPAMQDRLRLTKERIDGIAEGIRAVAKLPDPVGEKEFMSERPNGLKIYKVRVPLGVIAVIYEARPNVTADVFALCFKTGNAAILRGGHEALRTNIAVVDTLREALAEGGSHPDAVQLLTDTSRETAAALMHLREYVDVLIPRGSAGLIRAVLRESTVPVIETGAGNCHLYVDESADLPMAVKILVNAKTQRISVCNACESLVVHRGILPEFLPAAYEALKPWNVRFHADAEALPYLPGAEAATEEDFGREYLDYEISVKTVGSVEEAVEHINRYSTSHSETIVTEDAGHAETFLRAVDSACVYVNASTRFTDGFEFGFGAEIGISTQKLHARGPMGLFALTSVKYEIYGNGQVRQ
ncbi:MAG: glutamate-5-semialdehyde dehydrogenase, partial [Lachnospiraceae bacterium]|nr:glutamate-5-semialdehyde dehydrogenase [Lachnospiraceae bacterium]